MGEIDELRKKIVSSGCLYGSWSIEDVYKVGKKFKAKLMTNYGYEHFLTTGKTYELEVAPMVREMSPLCNLIGDEGELIGCHLERFYKLEQI